MQAAIRWVRDEGLLDQRIEILWHAGEPLLAGLSFYREAYRICEEELPPDIAWRFAFQTNATLINDDWAAFFLETQSDIGVSIDGPREWHNGRRLDRNGRGSYEAARKGIDCLRGAGITFGSISVLSRDALAHPKEMYEFLRELGVETCGFNAEELEGVNASSTQFLSSSAKEDARAFYQELFRLAHRDGSLDMVRELSKGLDAIAGYSKRSARLAQEGVLSSDMLDPFRIVSITFEGKLSTFAPELLGHCIDEVGEFTFGSVHQDTLEHVVSSDKYLRAHDLIQRGSRRCRDACGYYALCGGGSPSNKYFENGSFDSAETDFCRVSIMAPIDAVVAELESSLH